MIKNFLIIVFGLVSGIFMGFLLITYLPRVILNPIQNLPAPALPAGKATPQTKEVFGFLPYWFLDKARVDYSGFISTLNYFSLSIDRDGTILKSTNPIELEPGYYALTSGKVDPFLASAKSKNIKLSLTVFNGDQESINNLISDPFVHAYNLVNDIAPVMDKYGFSDLNLDIESIGVASPAAQLNYQQFVSEVSRQIATRNLKYTLSMDIIPVDFIRNDHLSVPANIVKFLDKIILMAYDFHSPSSYVTGPVAPLYGAGSVAEFDTQVAIDAALRLTTADKLLLGVPFYGYSWETIDNFERAAVVPSSAVIESSKDVEDLLANCATCSASFDQTSQEHYIVYKNNDTGTYQQIFYPDVTSIQSKINFLEGNKLGGLAIWALGYEGNTILNPIQDYLSH